MARTESPNEIEIKLRVTDAKALRRALTRIEASLIVPRTYESNTLYDTSRKDLAQQRKLIRIRLEHPASKGNRRRSDREPTAILTYKGPPQESQNRKTGSAGRQSLFKIREELEVTLNDGETLAGILAALGLRPSFRYEKFRTTYAIPGIRGLKLEFDETPIGLFLELEGDPKSIERAAKLLGYGPSDFMTQSYGALYIADCRTRGIKPAHMLFPSTK